MAGIGSGRAATMVAAVLVVFSGGLKLRRLFSRGRGRLQAFGIFFVGTC